MKKRKDVWKRQGKRKGDRKERGLQTRRKQQKEARGKSTGEHDSPLMSSAVAPRNRFFQSITFNSLSLALSLFLFLFIFMSFAFFYKDHNQCGCFGWSVWEKKREERDKGMTQRTADALQELTDSIACFVKILETSFCITSAVLFEDVDNFNLRIRLRSSSQKITGLRFWLWELRSGRGLEDKKGLRWFITKITKPLQIWRCINSQWEFWSSDCFFFFYYYYYFIHQNDSFRSIH